MIHCYETDALSWRSESLSITLRIIMMMMMMIMLLSIIVCVMLLDGVASFMISRIRHHSSSHGYKLRSTITDDSNDVSPVSIIVIDDQDTTTALLNKQKREDLKKSLYSKCAECDRGFSSIPSDRTAIDSIINELRTLSPEGNPTRNFFPDNNDTSESAPLDGAWKLIYTTAFDVLILGVNPFSITQSIYQVINSTGSAINVINVAPRLQAFLPQQLVGTGSTLRLKVYIDAKRKSDSEISLRFKSTEIKPITLLGNKISSFLPSLKLLLPQRILGGDAWKSSSSDSDSNSNNKKKNNSNSFGQSSGYFRVLYLDDECLIIQQNQPGGIFVSVRSSEPLESIL